MGANDGDGGCQYTGRELRFLADNREQAQRMRIEIGERIRAVVQGRDETFRPEGRFREPEEEDGERLWVEVDGVGYTAEEVLDGIREGWTVGPVPLLGRSYRRYAAEEESAVQEFERALVAHPVWPWLRHVSGVGPALAGKLLSRLDPRKAPHASSFWAYCGLATVPGERYACPACGLRRGWPVGYDVTGKHEALRDVPHLLTVTVWGVEERSGAAEVRLEDFEADPEAAVLAALRALRREWSGAAPWILRDRTLGDPESGLVEEAARAASEALAAESAGGEDLALTVDERAEGLPECDVYVRRGWRAGTRCRASLKKTAGPEDGVRVAQPKPRKGEPASYDQYAKKVCWQIATSFIRTGARSDSPYEKMYRRWREEARRERPNWADGRQDAKARRKVQKLFLSHLWRVWRTALDLPTPPGYAVQELGHAPEDYIGPWEMVDAEPPPHLADA